MADKPRLLWHSNAPHAGTGYGNQTGLFAPRLQDRYEVGISAFYGVEGSIIPWNGIPVMPGIGQTYGNETISDHVKAFFGPDPKAGLVMTLMDVWVLDPGVWSQFNTCSWVPVDHEPAPRPVRAFFEGSGAIPIAMSRFGQRMLEGLDPLYVPHGVDTKVYKPIDKAEARKGLGFPEDAYVVGMVAANKGNPSRKCFQEAFQAFKEFHAKHPEARLYLHTEANGRFDGVNLPDLMRAVGLNPEAVIFCDQYHAVHLPFQPEIMAKVYSAMDVLLAVSAGEGFGIPVIEAQACGTPVIVSDFSAQPELCGSGWTVEGGRRFTPIGSWQFVPDVEDVVDALRRAYSLPAAARKQMRERAREFAQDYDADLVTEKHMLPALEAVAERFAEREPVELRAAA